MTRKINRMGLPLLDDLDVAATNAVADARAAVIGSRERDQWSPQRFDCSPGLP
jgi:hypothetical protein